MSGSEVRSMLKKNGIKQWQVADKIGVSESTFIRWLRHALPEDKEQMILEAIEELTWEGDE